MRRKRTIFFCYWTNYHRAEPAREGGKLKVGTCGSPVARSAKVQQRFPALFYLVSIVALFISQCPTAFAQQKQPPKKIERPKYVPGEVLVTFKQGKN